MLPWEILKYIRRIEIRTKRLVNEVFAGEYESVFKGQGVEFSEVREYVSGDDIRRIDWNVTARMGHPFVKIFREERERTLIFIVDTSGSEYFGTISREKINLASEVTALLSFSALSNNDKISLLLFSDRIEKFVPPKKGRRHILRILRDLLYFKPKGKGTNISMALEHFNRMIRKKSIVFLISDFLDTGYEKPMKITARKHDLIAIRILDPLELSVPGFSGWILLEDAESGNIGWIDTGDRKRRLEYGIKKVDLLEKQSEFFSSNNIDLIDLNTSKPYVDELVRFFTTRERRLRTI
ncbi:MAG: DUF58 domain-containing protein [Candidatus Cloacimonadota bacterium]|nr:MAG: DUF58 domain-containing protein [Candidatus Cloacimonadota bacterium]